MHQKVRVILYMCWFRINFFNIDLNFFGIQISIAQKIWYFSPNLHAMDTFWINTKSICDIQTESPENMFNFSAHFCSQHDARLCHYSSRHSLVPLRGGPGLIPGQSLSDLWWVKWKWGSFAYLYVGFVIFVNHTDALFSTICLSPTLYSVTLLKASVNTIRLGDYPVIYFSRP
jgi:hypothetical protein